MTVQNLAKHILIYEYLYATTKPTKVVNSAVQKYKTLLRKTMNSKPKLFMEAKALYKEAYKAAWAIAFKVEGTEELISIGTIISKLLEASEPMLGKQFMFKVVESLYFAKDDGDIALMESNASKLAKALLEHIDGKSELSPLQIKLKSIKKIN